MPKTLPSFARVLHDLSLGETVDGAELLALPGFAEVETDWPIYECLDYHLDQLPELIWFAGELGEKAMPGSLIAGKILAGAIKHDADQFGYIDTSTLAPVIARSIWELGTSADLALLMPEKGTKQWL